MLERKKKRPRSSWKSVESSFLTNPRSPIGRFLVGMSQSIKVFLWSDGLRRGWAASCVQEITPGDVLRIHPWQVNWSWPDLARLSTCASAETNYLRRAGIATIFLHRTPRNLLQMFHPHFVIGCLYSTVCGVNSTATSSRCKFSFTTP